MKKALLVLAVLCVAGIFSAKAQYSPSDSAYACDLNYTSINTSSIPATTTDTLYLSRGSKILKDIRYGHRANGYALNATRDMALDIQLLSGSWDAYLFLLDSNFNQIAYDDDWDGMSSSYGSHILTAITAGQYYILVSEYSYDTNPLSYTLTIDTIATTPFNQLTYTPLATFTDTTVFDTFLSSYPNHPFFMWGENNIFKAKGYSFQGSQNQLITVRDNNYNAVYVLMDNNYNILKAGEHFFTHLLQQTGTYYLALLGSYENARSETNIKLIQCNYRTYYVDNINGDDSRNGLTLGTAIKTLDTALARSNGVGKYYLTEDYEFTNENPLGVYYGEIYPYQKDIRLYMPTNSGHDVIRIYGTLKFGEQDSNYYFIIDSSTTDGYDDILDADYPSTYLEVNNMKIRNSYIPSTVFWGDDIVLRNCEFTNDTVEDEFIGMDQSTYNSLKLINCTISQNTFYEDLIYQDYDNLRLTLENTTVSGNTLSYIYPAFFYKATINLTSGSWRNNTLDSNYRYNNNPNLSSQNCAGIWAESNSAINIGAGFTMDANNYLCIDPSSYINSTENLTAPIVAQIYPMKWDSEEYEYLADYYEGRRLLRGSASMLRANYSKYGVAQAASQLWYLHSDGKIYTTEEPVGIETADNAAVRMYPNPASDKVTIELQNTSATEICVMDIYGKTVVRKAVNGQSETIDLADLANGMYFVQIRNNSKVKATQKLVKR